MLSSLRCTNNLWQKPHEHTFQQTTLNIVVCRYHLANNNYTHTRARAHAHAHARTHTQSPLVHSDTTFNKWSILWATTTPNLVCLLTHTVPPSLVWIPHPLSRPLPLHPSTLNKPYTDTPPFSDKVLDSTGKLGKQEGFEVTSELG